MIKLQEILQLIFNILSAHVGFQFLLLEIWNLKPLKMHSFLKIPRGFMNLAKASESLEEFLKSMFLLLPRLVKFEYTEGTSIYIFRASNNDYSIWLILNLKAG